MNSEDQDFNESNKTEYSNAESKTKGAQNAVTDEKIGEEVLDVAEVATNIARGKDNPGKRIKELEAKIE